MRSKLIFILLFCFIGSAQAAPVTWTLDDVVIGNLLPDSSVEYSSLTGYFDYDADTNVYSGIFIQSEPGNYFGGSTTYSENAYTSWKPSAVESPSSNGVILSASSAAANLCPDICDMVLTMEFAATLTNSGGTISLSGDERIVGQTWGLVIARSIVSGSVSAVPVPAAVWLFGSALAGLAWVRRKGAS